MEKPLTKNIDPKREPLDLKAYEKAGGYQAARKAIKKMTPKEVQEEVTASNLRGRGGAGFGTGMKWSFVPMGEDAPKEKYFCCNADEMEPGSFKDRILMEGDPNLLVEGLICAAYAIQATGSYIFLRWVYRKSEERLKKAIAEAYNAGYLGKNIFGSDYSLEMKVHVSAGRYMCGEETGLLNAIEGKRANPRAKPPYPQTVGLFGKPSVVNNVESLCNVPGIIVNGADWYKGLSKSKDGGTKIYGVSGNVKNPGGWELPMGTVMREIIEEYAGGMKDGYKLRAIIPGGASTEFLLDEHLDTPMDFDSLQKYGSRMGTGTMMVLDDRACPVGLLANMQKFFAQESCGWCTPCRDGLPWVHKTLVAIENGEGRMEDLDMLQQHCKWLGPGNTYCALAPGAVEPLQSGLKFFREDFERHIKDKRCPWRK
jgi:NADH-quinone oxidoreductase subunit F